MMPSANLTIWLYKGSGLKNSTKIQSWNLNQSTNNFDFGLKSWKGSRLNNWNLFLFFKYAYNFGSTRDPWIQK